MLTKTGRPVAGDILRLILDLLAIPAHDLDQQEVLFSELDEILETVDNETIDHVMSDPDFIANKDAIHHLRAHYEYRREMILADDIIAQHNKEVAEEFRSHDWYSKALEFEIAALAPYQCKRILFVGSGPFPTSPMAFLFNDSTATVTCMERFEEACERGRKVADIFGLPALKIINKDGALETDFSDYDCVIVGLVVGAVDEQKSDIVDHFLKHVPPQTLLCFRTADGSGRVIYPSVDMESLAHVPHHVLESPPHKSFTLAIVDRRS